ncbi:hypothetical protein NM688_g2628 [Phlebia brevispora]|uniref:Uncharacterized protein n=1 Tax=Phlebia brevispora TaxID=194682 RepID=A0ACC1T8R1_9APHY|nr:hypothetical protein NM688_g2628 [Phlebia brevispora]
MPICTSCTHAIEFLYTIYDSADNLRLEQCSACHAFADPYVEHDTLTLWIDLILLKRDVYRHLLFNRGIGARKLGRDPAKTSDVTDNRTDTRSNNSTSNEKAQQNREKERWLHINKLGFALVSVDAFIRWAHLSSSLPRAPQTTDIASWNHEAVGYYLRIWIGCLIETVGFHAGVILASFLVLQSLALAKLREKPPLGHEKSQNQKQTGISTEFRYSHIPLSLLYSSLNKLFLLVLLAIWRPASVSSSSEPTHSLPAQYNGTQIFTNPLIVGALELLDDDKLDREWVVRNILGGIAAGFGLRVVLDCHPIFTTIVILVGWVVKTALANIVSGWAGTRHKIVIAADIFASV